MTEGLCLGRPYKIPEDVDSLIDELNATDPDQEVTHARTDAVDDPTHAVQVQEKCGEAPPRSST
jgi:hypothetical protein